jgi:uncharacterized membrane protein HdeD (DUF308 family)
MVERSTVEVARRASKWSMVWGVSLIIFGMLAIGAPFLAAVAVSGLIAWLIVFAGAVHLALAFHSRGASSVIWKLLVGIAYIVFGGYLILHPVMAVASLTLLLGSLFLLEGVLSLVMYFKMRSTRGSNWMLFDGAITLLLGLMIYLQWPSSSAWAIGTLVGVSLIMSGITRVMMSAAARKTNAKGETPLAAAA